MPRFGQSAYYRSNRPSGVSAKDRPPRFYNAAEQQPHIGVKDPARQHTVFRSNVERFPHDVPSFEARGLHPHMKVAQPSFATGDSKHLDADNDHWKKPGFFSPRGPRLPVSPRGLTAELQASDLQDAGHHVDGMRLTLGQTVHNSPRRLKVMSSRSERFTTPHTYVANEPRQVLAIKPPYQNDLGPGSYDVETSTLVVNSPDQPQCNFASGSPRLPKDEKPLNCGTNTASVMHDQKTWTAPRVWTAKAHFGRQVHGPQTGSYEGLEGLNRSASPERRSPDVTYSLDHSQQKRPLSEQVSHSKQKYSASFRSHSPRLEKSYDEKRSLAYPRDATDQFDLSASASSSPHGRTLTLSQFSLASATEGGGPRVTSPVFASETQRFPSQAAPPGSEVDLVEADRKRWHASGQPLTTTSPRFHPRWTSDWEATSAQLPSPGPGTYLNQRVWGGNSGPSSPRTQRPPAPPIEDLENSSARMRLVVA